TASGLIANAASSAALDNANAVGTLSGRAGTTFAFTNASGLTVGAVPAVLGVGSQSDLATTAGDVRLRTTTGNLVLASNVCAGVSAASCASTIGGNNAALVAAAGSVSESGGFVSATALTVNATTAAQTVKLDNANQVGTLAGQSGGAFQYVNAVGL